MNKEELEKLINSNSNYWEKRSLLGKLDALENEKDYLRRLESFYTQANKQIDDKLAKVYARYAKENKITVDEAYKILPKAMEKDYKNDVMDYIAKAKSGDPQYRSYLLNQSIMHKHSVLDQLRTEVRNAVYSIDMDNTQGKFLSKIYQNANYQMQYSGDETFAKIDPNKIQQVLEQNWSGQGSFSENIWKNKDKLAKALDEVMMQGIAIGESYDKIAAKLAKKMDTSKSNAKRLIVTEAARMDTEGKLAYYRSTGVKELINIATLDMRTSDICIHIDGTIVPIDEARIGLNVPPFHPWCRTVVSPHYEGNEPADRVYRDKETGKTKSGRYRTYKEYLEEELGDKKKVEALASTRNDLLTLINATATIYVAPAREIQEGQLSLGNNNVHLSNSNVQDLTGEDKKAINEYTDWGYKEINKSLRDNQELSDSLEELKNNLEEALDKLPFYEGDVQRGISIPKADLQDFLNNYQKGDILLTKEFLSTSAGSLTEDFVYSDIIFKIKSKTGRHIKEYSGMKEENEVLFKTNSTFIVKEVIPFEEALQRDRYLYKSEGYTAFVVVLEEVIL